MKIKYKILILLTIILLSVSVVNAANIENNYTNQKHIHMNIQQYNKTLHIAINIQNIKTIIKTTVK